MEKVAKEAFRLAIAQGKIPRYLYKYTSVKNCLRIINEGTLYFADYHTFNDPFECNAIIDTSNTKAEWKAFLLENGVNPIEAANLAEKVANNPAKAERDVKRIIMENQDATGFLCLTAKRDNLLMWSHYANQHEGCCVKLDLLNDIDLFFRIRAIAYDNKYISYNYLQNHGGAFDAICHKSADWAYEEEYRVLSFNYIGAKPMATGTVKDVYLGCRMKDEDKTDILSATASTTKQPGIIVYQTETDAQAYKLNFIRL